MPGTCGLCLKIPSEIQDKTLFVAGLPTSYMTLDHAGETIGGSINITTKKEVCQEPVVSAPS